MDHTITTNDLHGVKSKRWKAMFKLSFDPQFDTGQDRLDQDGLFDPHQHATGRWATAGPQSLAKDHRQGLGTALDQLQEIQTMGIGQTGRSPVL